MKKLTLKDLEKVLRNLVHVDTLEYWFPVLGIRVVPHIPINGIAISDKDIVDIYQHNKLIKTLDITEYYRITAKVYTLKMYYIGSESGGWQQRWTKESDNEVYKIIKELGCQGPAIEEEKQYERAN